MKSQNTAVNFSDKVKAYVRVLSLRIEELEFLVQNLTEANEFHKKLNGELRRELQDAIERN